MKVCVLQASSFCLIFLAPALEIVYLSLKMGLGEKIDIHTILQSLS